MYFRLLHGVHLEKGGKKYEAKWERNKDGALEYTSQPIVQSDNDLVKQFGTNKFQRMNDKEAIVILSEQQDEAVGQPDSKDSVPTAPVETEVAKAAKQGAVEITEPPGKNVTRHYPKAEKKGLAIYRKSNDAYLVHSSDGEAITELPITKIEMVKLIKEFSE